MNGVKAVAGEVPLVHQGLLENVVKSLFGSQNVQKNVRKDGLVKSPTTGFYLEIDVWVPDCHICFEFQDVYHYTSTWENQRTMDDITKYDQIKQEEIKRRGDTLIVVPCWWDSTEESLTATVRFYRPDLLQTIKKDKYNVPPISLNRPEDFFDTGSIPGVGELMLASFPQSLQFKTTISPLSSWWLGEKYDGIRALWNPKEKTLYSRAGNELEIPNNFENYFPTIFLDSEIWFGRGYFPDSQKLTSTTFIFINWADLRFVGFDDASRGLNKHPFEFRYASVLEGVQQDHLFIIPAMRVLCTRKRLVNYMSQQIIADGGEGVILRQPKSIYEHGRSEALLKLKTSRGDKEALVVEVLDDGTTYELMLPDGQTFTAPNQEFKTGATVPIRGDIVTFTYDSFSRRALPINPKIFRKRSDVTWEEVIQNHEKDAQSDAPKMVMGYTHKPTGYWLSQQGNNVRLFFEEFAKNNNFDPLVPGNWYKTPRKSIVSTKKSSSMLEQFKGSLVKALQYAFPDIGIEASGFDIMSRRHWHSEANRRKFFEEYAREHSFDPLNPNHWYELSRDDLMNVKSAGSVMLYYGGSVITALIHLFPEIGLERTKFPVMPRHHWTDMGNRRKFFDKLAESKGFDPLIAEHWYEIVPQVLNSKEANTLLIYYGGNYVKALVHLYPDIGLDPSKFHYLPHHHWMDIRNRRKFFISFAHQQGFDPFDPKGWYDNVSTESIQASKWGKTILSYYKGNLAYALKQLFPEVNFDLNKLPIVPKNYWSESENRKAFFMRLAKENDFDPLSLKDWYQLGRDKVLKYKGASAVLSYYGGSYISALLDLFPSLSSERHKYSFITRSYWKYMSNRRKFFTDIATKHSFDPLKASNWYSLKSEVILQSKGVHAVLAYHSGSFIKALKALFPEIGLDERRFNSVPRNYWTVAVNRRKFFENIALSMNLNPLVPEHWYSVPAESILNAKGASSILFYHKGSLPRALTQLFPEVEFDKNKLTALSKNYWEDPENRKRFFFKFAKENCFDPKVPENWYYLSKEVFSATQGASAVLEFYGGNIAKGLKEIFPNIEWDESNFVSLPKNSLADVDVRRKFLEKYAATLGFNPLVPENWYKASFDSLLTIKGASSFLLHYHGSVVKALMEAFPEIGLDESKFAVVTRKYWKNVENRKLFFIEFAKSRNFDPYLPNNWYNIPLAQFLTTKGASSIIACYGSFHKALLALFPDIGFEKKKFSYS